MEMELAHEFQTSRGPIREALRQLENEGIVEYTRNVGCSVRTFSFWDSYEVYLLRTNYEAVSVRFLNGKSTRGNDTENGRDSGANEKNFNRRVRERF